MIGDSSSQLHQVIPGHLDVVFALLVAEGRGVIVLSIDNVTARALLHLCF